MHLKGSSTHLGKCAMKSNQLLSARGAARHGTTDENYGLCAVLIKHGVHSTHCCRGRSMVCVRATVLGNSLLQQSLVLSNNWHTCQISLRLDVLQNKGGGGGGGRGTEKEEEM